MARVYVIMGVSGSGKSTVGAMLARRLGVPFYDGDDFHPPANVAKMAAGSPLTDEDRAPWLARLGALIGDHLSQGRSAVLACSALKRQYRNQLRAAGPDGVYIIYLQGSPSLLQQRLAERPGHFMKADMLASQFEALEPPSAHDTLIIDAAYNAEEIVEFIVRNSDAPASAPPF